MNPKEHNTNAAKKVRKLDAEGNPLEEYPSAAAAAQANNISYRYLMACIQQGRTCHEMRFAYRTAPAFQMPVRKEVHPFQAGHNPYEVYRTT